ncbi:UPF0147 family protein [Candidatus Woesearchaeota archaeon]|nr:UPF0147 family protein [Candidatus Woesearchaeota archaeon]
MAEQVSEMDTVIKSLSEIQEDATVPRNVRTKIEAIVTKLKEDTEISIKVNKTLNELDEVANDVNLQSYTRTQIWNVMSALEKL